MSDSHNMLVIASAAIAILIAAAVCYYYYSSSSSSSKRGKSRLPPGYAGWPLIGEVFSFMKPIESITTLGYFMDQHISRFGKIFTTNLLGKRTIVSADPELNRLILNDAITFESFLPKSIIPLIGDSDFHKGDANKQLRSILTNFLGPSRLRCFVSDADTMARRLIGSWEDGSVVSVVHAAERFNLSVLLKILLGMEQGEAKTEELKENFERVFEGVFSTPLNFPGTRYYKAIQANKVVERIIGQLLEERKNSDQSMRTEQEDLLECALGKSTLSNQGICNLVRGVFVAGVLSSTFIALVVYFLKDCPKAIDQLREEQLKVGGSKGQDGSGVLTWDGYKKMEFTQCVINEALRLGNLARYFVRTATKDTEFKGYKIPHGFQVIADVSAVHLDPSLYTNPEHFDPWRWMSISGADKTKNFVPFGGRPRLCPGAELARLEMAVFLHHFILNYNWISAEPDKPIAVRRVRFPKGLPIKLRSVSQTI